ncbi:MAG: DUF2029 domain-containing protein [Chloroflexi bacterium]|nr:MAG: DUF2029 domain-containing protein [Chloroflexota bacterium]TME45481.1 MAG: DUF2029 domain-containing protein [Chloroflexota bacterium]
MVAVILLVFNLVDELTFLQRTPEGTDFFLYLVAARLVRAVGWAQTYNPDVFLPVLQAAGVRLQPYLNPPLVAWLVMPLSFLSYPVALAAWSGLLAAGGWLVWKLTAPGARAAKLAYGLSALGLYVVFLSFRLGNVTWLALASLAASYWLLRQNRVSLAGIALAGLAVKPQVALLVPLALLAAGYWRTFLAWAATTIPIAALSLLVMGLAGFENFLRAVALAHSMVGDHQPTLAGLLGWSPLSAVLMAVAAALGLLVAFFGRHSRPELPLAAGISASLLASPYVNGADLAGLVLAAWLMLRLQPPIWFRAYLLLGYCELAFAVGILPLTVGLQLGFLASLLIIASEGHRFFPSHLGDGQVGGLVRLVDDGSPS